MSTESVSDAVLSLAPDIRELIVVGVGNEISADDGAGPLIIRRLANWLLNFLLLDAGTMPENFVSRIAESKPSHVIFIDAAAIPGEPGSIAIVDSADVDNVISTTHHIPLGRVISRLRDMCGCEVLVIGIKPKSIETGGHISTPVMRGVVQVVDIFLKLSVELRKGPGPHHF